MGSFDLFWAAHVHIQIIFLIKKQDIQDQEARYTPVQLLLAVAV